MSDCLSSITTTKKNRVRIIFVRKIKCATSVWCKQRIDNKQNYVNWKRDLNLVDELIVRKWKREWIDDDVDDKNRMWKVDRINLFEW